MKKTLIFVLTIASILIPMSCEDTTIFVDCSKCYTEKPIEGTLKVKISYNNENLSVPITIYLGDIEDGNILQQYITFGDTNHSYYYDGAEFGQYYSVVATYQKSGRTIKVVDGKKLRVRLDNSSCDNSCYVIEGDEFDVTLK